jgi:site-specific recombinase XerD
MLYKKEGSRFWWYDFMFDGRRIQESARTENRKAALDIEAGRRIQLAKGEVGLIDTPKFTIGELLDGLERRWLREDKASAQNLSLLKKTREDWKTKWAHELTKKDLEVYLDRRKKEEYSVASSNRILQTLRRAFRIADVPWPKFSLPSEKGNIRTQRYTPEQWKKILAALPDDGLRTFCEWSYLVGMRKGEASKLTWDMCPKPYDVLHVPASLCKNRTARDIQLDGERAKIIQRCLENRAIKAADGTSTTERSTYIFHRGEGLPIYEFRKSWKTACEAAGVSGRFHDIRATFATDGRKAGIPESVMMALGNWSTRAVFDRYNKIDSEDLKQARETLDRARATG